MRYSDCYPGCGGEDCPCCEIHHDHMADDNRDRHYPDCVGRSLFDDYDPNHYFDDEDWTADDDE